MGSSSIFHINIVRLISLRGGAPVTCLERVERGVIAQATFWFFMRAVGSLLLGSWHKKIHIY